MDTKIGLIINYLHSSSGPAACLTNNMAAA